jgi:multidrug efflux pump
MRLNAEELTQYYVHDRQRTADSARTIAFDRQPTTPNALVEYNQLNSATFQAVPLPGVTEGQAVAFLEDAAKRLLPAGFSHDYLSESRQYVKEGNASCSTPSPSLLVIYLVLAAQFESLRDPLVIMVSVPMSICGALIPLYFGNALGIDGATVNIYTQVGLVTLIGLISKHGILMVTFANDMQRNEHADRRTAIQHAARIRLRPILMTTAAMVLGVVPLLMASGAGAASRVLDRPRHRQRHDDRHLFTLFVLPAVYTLLGQDHRRTATSRRTLEIAAVT